MSALSKFGSVPKISVNISIVAMTVACNKGVSQTLFWIDVSAPRLSRNATSGQEKPTQYIKSVSPYLFMALIAALWAKDNFNMSMLSGIIDAAIRGLASLLIFGDVR